MDETAVQIIKEEIRRHRSLSTMANDMQLKVDHLTVAWALEDLLSAPKKKEKNNGYQDGTKAHDPGRRDPGHG